MIRLKDEQLALEKSKMSNQFMSQIAAVHQVERATARVRVETFESTSHNLILSKQASC